MNGPVSHLTATIRLERRSDGTLLVQLPGNREQLEVFPLRLFPLSEPQKWIALLNPEGREVALLDSLENLPAAARELLNEELSRREFVPIIRQITWVSGNSEPCSWRVRTDRGETEFVLKNEDDIRRLGARSVLVVDSHGIRYLIPDREQLDSFSQRIVEWYV
jgi:hypothetical protein